MVFLILAGGANDISSLSFVSLIVDLEDYYSVELADEQLDFSPYAVSG